jgi:hypothetical protein
MAMTVRQIVDSLNRGSSVFAEDDWNDLIKGTLVGMVANSEVIKCEHGEFTFYIAWQEGTNDCEADVAHRMAKAIRAA